MPGRWKANLEAIHSEASLLEEQRFVDVGDRRSDAHGSHVSHTGDHVGLVTSQARQENKTPGSVNRAEGTSTTRRRQASHTDLGRSRGQEGEGSLRTESGEWNSILDRRAGVSCPALTGAALATRPALAWGNCLVFFATFCVFVDFAPPFALGPAAFAALFDCFAFAFEPSLLPSAGAPLDAAPSAGAGTGSHSILMAVPPLSASQSICSASSSKA